jgi:hypothetical protein
MTKMACFVAFLYSGRINKKTEIPEKNLHFVGLLLPELCVPTTYKKAYMHKTIRHKTMPSILIPHHFPHVFR